MHNIDLAIKPQPQQSAFLDNKYLITLSPIQRIEWALQHLPATHITSSSFGIQSAVMLHMMTSVDASIPVILTDTGHLFPETYQFIEQLSDKFDLNLHIYKATQSSLPQENPCEVFKFEDDKNLKKYHHINKVEPFERAMKELNAKTWFSGIRQEQSMHRKSLSVVEQLRGHYKVHPIIDWTQADIHNYLTKHKLPYHPMKHQGYDSIGDIHSTLPLSQSTEKNYTRPRGMQRECGLHV